MGSEGTLELAEHDFGELGSDVDGSVILTSKRGFAFALASSGYWIPVAVRFAVALSAHEGRSTSLLDKYPNGTFLGS